MVSTHISNGGWWWWTALGRYPDSALICFLRNFRGMLCIGYLDSEVTGGRMYNCELLNETFLQQSVQLINVISVVMVGFVDVTMLR